MFIQLYEEYDHYLEDYDLFVQPVQIEEKIPHKYFHLDKQQFFDIKCKFGKKLDKIADYLAKIYQDFYHQFPIHELDGIMDELIENEMVFFIGCYFNDDCDSLEKMIEMFGMVADQEMDQKHYDYIKPKFAQLLQLIEQE